MPARLAVLIRHDRILTWLLVGLFVLGGCAQAGLWLGGLYSVSADESARAIMAHSVTWATALDPEIWPPFYKMAVGAGLALYNDLFVTPRLIAFVMGLATLGALTFLAHRLFENRLTTVITAALGIFLSHRVVFGAAPQSEMFYNGLVLMGFAFVAGWLRHSRARDLFWASGFFALASLVRFEAWFISAVFGLGLAYLCFAERRLTFLTLAICGVIVSSAPLLIMGTAYTVYGTLEPLFITGTQAEMFQASAITLLMRNHGYLFAHDLLLSPLILALIPLVSAVVRGGPLRRWIVFIGATLAVVSLATIVTGSASYAAHWRLSGVWTLGVTPFLAVWIVEASLFYASRSGQKRMRAGLCIGATLACMAGFALATMDIIQMYNEEFSTEERQAGRFLRRALAETSGNILLEPTDFNFLDIIVSANAADRTVLSSGDDPLKVGLYVGYDDYWRAKDPAIYKDHLEPRFGLAEGGDTVKFAEHDIAFVVTANPASGMALDRSGRAIKAAQYGPWLIYRVER